MVRTSPRRQGDLGEFSAIEWLGMHGYDVSLPMGHSPDYDVIADDGEQLLRVQVKTSTVYERERWMVHLATCGGNQSWNGVIKRFSATRCDRLFVVVADGRRWFMPSRAVTGGRYIVLGGPKYAEFEVERGRPLPSAADP
jgi:hypothetical protein